MKKSSRKTFPFARSARSSKRALRGKPAGRPTFEQLEDRTLLTATLYVDFGDRFPSGVLNTTVGALDTHVFGANPDIDGPVLSDSTGADYAAGTAVRVNSVNSLYGASAATFRSTMMELVRRFYQPLDITVVELTSSFQTVNGHSVRAAANLDDISATLGANEGDAKNNDSYVIVGQFQIGASNDNPATFASNGYGGLSTGTDIGGNNNNDGTAFVLLIGSGDSAQFNGVQIAHEAGHAFGLRHVYRQDTGNPPPGGLGGTGPQYDMLHQSEVMSYLGYDSQGGYDFFTRYPMMRGDGNTDPNVLASAPSPLDQMINDPNIGAGAVEYVTGTGANDIITITKTGATTATVSVQAFADAAFTTAIDAPGATGTSYSYSITLTKPLIIDAGSRTDRIVIDGDLNTTITVRGMHGTDRLVIDGKGAASATYTASTSTTDGTDGNSDRRGRIAIGSTTIDFQEFEVDAGNTLSNVTIQNVTTVTVPANSGVNNFVLNLDGSGQPQLGGTSDGVQLVPMSLAGVNQLIINGASSADTLTVDYTGGNPIPAGGVTFNGGGGADTLVIPNGTFTIATYNYTNATDGSVVLDGAVINYTGLSPILNTGTVADAIFNLPAGADNAFLEDDAIPGNNQIRLRSSPTTFEVTTFTKPTSSLTINTNGTDTLTVTDLDGSLNATLFVTGAGADDTLTLTDVSITNAPNDGGLDADGIAFITITGGTFSDNNDDGIDIDDFVTATLTNVTAEGNLGVGFADGLEAGSGGTLTITGGSFSGNEGNGLDLFVITTVTISGTTINDNIIEPGLLVDTVTTLTLSDLTVLGNNTGGNLSNIGTLNFTGTTGATRDVITVGRDFIQHTRDPLGANVVNQAINYANVGIMNVNGDDQGADPNSRDDVIVADNVAGAVIGITYQAGGGVNVSGYSTDLRIRTTETVRYTNSGGGAILTVTGTAADEDFTVAPISDTRTLVFNGGNPWDGPSESATPFQASQLVGVAGGGTAPDLDLQNLATTTGFTLDAGAGLNRLYIYGPSSTDALTSGTLDYFGFGAGVLIPTFAVGFDRVDAQGNTNFVDITSDRLGAATLLVRTNFNPASLSNGVAPGTAVKDIRLIVNTGFEAGVAGDNRADQVFTSARPDAAGNRFDVLFNGGRPTAPAEVTPPVGDQFNLAAIGLNVWSDQSFPTNVTLQSQAANTRLVDYTDFEDVRLISPTVNIFGDNNTPATVQHDEYIIVGTDQNAFSLQINRSSPIQFFGVNTLNVFGGHDETVHGADTDTGSDRISITPFAALGFFDRAWEIVVSVDGGQELDPTTEEDRLSYTGVAGLVDRITIDADATGPGRGRIYDPNIVHLLTVDPNGLAVSFRNTENINVNANSGDNDSLTIQTSQASDNVYIRFDPDRTGGKPGDFTAAPTDIREDDIVIRTSTDARVFDIVIDDGDGTTETTEAGTAIRQAAVTDGFKAVTINTREGDDNVTLNLVGAGTAAADDDAHNPTGGGQGSLPLVNGLPINITINAAEPNASDTLSIVGNIDQSDTFTVTPGANSQAGTVAISGFDTGSVSYTGVETIFLNGGTGTGTDGILLVGTGANNSFTLTGTGALAGTAQVDANAAVVFASLGTDASTVTMNGLGGDDLFSVTPIADWGLGQINVNGGEPSASDRLVVNGLPADDAIDVTPTGPNSADIVGAGPVPVIATGIESLTINGQGGDDDLRVLTPAGDNVITVTPGAAADAAAVAVDGLLPFDFRNLGTGGTFSVIDAGGNDSVTVRGSDAIDVFTVAATTGTVTVQTGATVHIPILSTGVDSLTLEGLAAGDTFNVTGPQPFTTLTLSGGEGGDTANVTGDGTAVTVDLELTQVTVTGGGLGTVVVREVESLNVDAAGGDVTADGTANDDTLTYTPLTANTGRLALAGLATAVTLNNVGALTIDGLGGSNTLVVNANQANNTIAVTPTSVTVDALQPVDVYANIADLRVNGLGGSDIFNVTPSPTTAIFIDGGDPVGVLPGDQLNIDAGADNVTFNAGPESDQGAFLVGANQPVSFDNIESAAITTTGTVTISGTNGDDDITIIGLGANSLSVSVNGGPAVVYTGLTALTVQGLAGDDDIDIDVNVPDLGVAITVDGGLPVATGDELTITGIDGTADTPIWTPTSQDDGTFTVAGTTITVNDVESLIYDGEADNETLTVNTPAAIDSTIRVTVGSTRDAGRVAVDSLLAVSFQNLGFTGTVAINDPDAGDADRIVYDGTAGNDSFTVTDNTVDLVNGAGNHVDLTQTNVEALTLNGFDGDDTFTINASALWTGGIVVSAGNPSASDNVILNGTAAADVIALTLAATGDTVTGVVGGPILLTDVENLTVNSLGGDDTLTVDNLGGTTDLDTATFNSGGDAGDTFTATGTANDDVFTVTPISPTSATISANGVGPVVTVNLAAAATSTFTVEGAADVADVVNVLGTNNHDVITVDSPNRTVTVENAAGTVYKAITLGATVEEVTALGRLGNDTFLVIPAPATATGPGGAPPGTLVPINLLIHIDGGAPSASDALVIAQADGAALPASDFVVIRKSRRADEGVVRVYRDGVALPDISYVDTEIVSPVLPPVANPAQDPNLLVMGPDNNEENEFLSTATFLGNGSTFNVPHQAIFPNAFEHRFVVPDNDWFRVVAKDTGTLDFQVYFRMFAAAGAGSLPAGGDLSLEAYDVDGTRIDNVGTTFGTNDADANERIRIPVVAGQTYYLRVFGANNQVVNGYDLSVVNTPAPTPFDLELQDGLNLLSVAQEVPAPVNPTATSGFATFEFNAALNTFNLDLFVTGIGLTAASGLNQLASAHLHVGAPGVAGAVIVPLPVASFVQEPGGLRLRLTNQAFPAANVADLLAGNVYINVHTNINAAGELRGQIVNIRELSDTGRSQLDNYTRDNTPTIIFRLDDGLLLHDLPGNDTDDTPPDQVTRIPFQGTTLAAGYRIAIFDEGPAPNQLPQTLLGFATQIAEGVYTFTTPVLADGSHFLSARVQMVDPATPTQTGYGARSQSLEIVVDTVAPPVFFGQAASNTDGLEAGSDSGVVGQPGTFSDRTTNVIRPRFFGVAEANSVVRLYADLNGNGTVDATDLLLGLTTAVPIDGTNVFPNGQWTITSNYDLNNPAFFNPADGLRRLLVTAEDLAGNVSNAAALNIFVDTQGPQVTDVRITGFPAFNLFALKTGNLLQGPTPLVNSLTISLRDLPPRVAEFLNNAIVAGVASTPGGIVVRGDNTGIIPITSITVTNNPPVAGAAATATIVITFAQPLPDDRYTLTILDTAVVDIAGNRLDGNSNAQQPLNNPAFPSGDGQPGGDFVARFTVDSRPEIGTACCGSIYIDLNGNGEFDPNGQDNDQTNADKVFRFGLSSDAIFAGRFFNGGAFHGYDGLGAYGFANGAFRFLLDLNSDGTPDLTVVPTLQINGLPVAGNFNAGKPGDEIGVFDGQGRWYLDTNGNNNLDGGDLVLSNGLTGFPIVGDFDGNGQFDLATYRPDQDTFFFDLNPLGAPHVQRTLAFGVPGVTERPVAADINRDGVTDIGLFAPDRAGVLPQSEAEWYILISTGAPVAGQINTLAHPFQPAPLGNDLFYKFGDARSLPVIGNFDPPVGVDALSYSTQVAQAYDALLGRPSDGTSNAAWTDLIQSGRITYRQFVISLLGSDEYYVRSGGTPQGFVTRLYQDLLGRAPSAEDLAAWTASLRTATRVQVAEAVANSPEALANTNGILAQGYISTANFVRGVYQQVLGRAASNGEAMTWARWIVDGQLTRAGFVNAVLGSEESHRRIVDGYYRTLLNRAAEAGALAYWSSVLNRGARLEDVMVALLTSAEYAQKHATDTSFAGQVRGLYTGALGRSAQDSEVAFWQSSGATLRDVAYAVAYSAEFRSKLVDGYYRQFFGRGVDDSGVRYWVSVMNTGATQELVQALLLSSDEFFNRSQV